MVEGHEEPIERKTRGAAYPFVVADPETATLRSDMAAVHAQAGRARRSISLLVAAAVLALFVILIHYSGRSAVSPSIHGISRLPAIQTQRLHLKKTLGEMLQGIVQAVSTGKDSLLSIDWLLFLTILFLAASASRSLRSRIIRIDRPWKRLLYGPHFYLTLLFITLIWFRFPVIATPLPLGLDESVFLSGAATLKRDPVFWRTLESTTSGPLNYYPLLLSELLGVPPDFAVARLFAVFLSAGIMAVLYCICRLIVSDFTSRLALLPLWLFWITTVQLDFVQYSSDLIPMLIISAATYCGVRSQQNTAELGVRRRRQWFLSCAILLGLLPLAKLQSCLGGAAVGVCAIFWEIIRGRGRRPREAILLVTAFVAAGLFPTVVVLCGVMASGALDRFIVSYLLFNLEFTAHHTTPLWSAIIQAIRASFNTPDFGGFARCVVGILIASIVIAATATQLKTIGQSSRLIGRCSLVLLFLLLSGAALLLAVALRGTVGTEWWYYHYLLYFAVPVIPLTAIAVDICSRIILRRIWRPRSRVVLRELMIAILFGVTLIPGIDHLDADAQSYLLHSRVYPELRREPEAEVAVDLSRPGDTLAVWGWHADIYVETQLAQATSMGTIERELGTGENARMVNWFRAQYLRDLKLANPSVFIDTTGDDDQTYSNVEQFGYETFPELKQYVTDNYVRLQDAHNARIYVSRARYKELGLH